MDWQPLLDLADEGSFQRGQDYARRRLVQIRSQTHDQVLAEAHGQSTYDVVLAPRDWSCTCPVGFSGMFCKHLVATALLASSPFPSPENEPAPQGADDLDVVADWLHGLGAAGLRDLIGVLAERHPEALDALRHEHGRLSGDVTHLNGVVDSLRVRGHQDWRRSDDHGRRAHRVAEELEESLTPASAVGLLPLLERAIDHLNRAMKRSDDSSGIQGGALDRLLDLHPECAALASPDPTSLARWLVRTGTSEDGWPAIDVVAYAEPLGDAGVAAYRKELDKASRRKHDSALVGYCHQRLAVLSGDVDEIVRAVGRGLSGWHRYPDLVDALLEAGHPEEALTYAVEAIDRPDVVRHLLVPLVDTAVRLLRERGGAGARDEVLRLRSRQLEVVADSRSYGSLRKAAKELSTWPTVRLDALDVLLERAPQVWLTVLLDEGEVDLAWESARTMSIDPTMRHTLLRARAKTHPGDEVFDGYEKLIDATLVPTDQQNYRQAVVYLGELRRLSDTASLTGRYVALVERLLETHRRRPTLVAMLRRAFV